MAWIERDCPGCSRPLRAFVSQHIRWNGAVGWAKSLQCSRCGWHTESHGGEPLPDDVRSANLEEEGEWALIVPAPASRPAEAAKVVRERLGLSLQEALRLVRLRGEVALSGTPIEVERRRRVLAAAGVESRIERRSS